MLKKILAVLTVFSSLSILSGYDYSTIQEQDEMASAARSEVLDQYQCYADLVSNLINTIKGYTKREGEVLIKVTEARSKVGSIQMTVEGATDPEKLRQFQQAQGELSSALSRLLVMSENHPQLKADQSFRGLQAQLEDTENRTMLAHNNYIKPMQVYNTTIRRSPDNLTAKMLGLKQYTNFSAENESAVPIAPKVSF